MNQSTTSIPPKKLPAAPNKHWLWKHGKDMAPNPLAFIMSNIEVLGDTFEAELPSRRFIMTSNADLIKHVLQTNHRNYRKTKSYEEMKLLLGNGLVTSKGDFWRKQRRLAQPAFYKKNLENLFKSMAVVVEDYLDELEEKKGQEVDIAHEMMAVTAKVVIKSLFSADLEGDLLKVYDSMTFIQRYMVSRMYRPMFKFWYQINGRHGEYKKYFEVMDSVIQNLIRERNESGEQKDDLLQMLMDARYEETMKGPQTARLEQLLDREFHYGSLLSGASASYLPRASDPIAESKSHLGACLMIPEIYEAARAIANHGVRIDTSFGLQFSYDQNVTPGNYINPSEQARVLKSILELTAQLVLFARHPANPGWSDHLTCLVRVSYIAQEDFAIGAFTNDLD